MHSEWWSVESSAGEEYVHICSFWSCDGPRPLSWWGRGQMTSSSFMSPLASLQHGEAFTFLSLTAHGELWYIDWQLVWAIPVVCVTAKTCLMMGLFMVTVAVISSIKPFRWRCSCFRKSLVIQKWSAFWCDFLTSLTKVERASDITQAANSKTSLLFMNQCWLCNVVTVPPGFGPQYCLHMLLLFVMP